MAQITNIVADGKSAKLNGKAAAASHAIAPDLDVPPMLREAAEASVSQAKEAFARMKSATEAASGIFAETFEAAQSHGVAMTLKAVEIAKANADASFDFLKAYLGAKTIADGIEVQTAYARKQFDVLSVHVKDLQDASQKAAVDIARPGHAAWEKGSQST
jgi:phasin